MRKILSVMMILSVLLGFSNFGGERVSAASNLKELEGLDIDMLDDEILKEMFNYISSNEHGKPHFDVDQARLDGKSKELLDQGKAFNDFSDSYFKFYNNSVDSDRITTKISIPVWGNWCGPGYGGGPTKGLLDAACKKHDLDYKKYGYFDCASDARLIGRIQRDLKKMGFVEKIVARNVMSYFFVQIKANGCY
ncbi:MULTISPECIES: hypothetical protein [Bacteria]|nr:MULTISPECIES: hypothetical protein [Bacillus]USD81060.1 hypothetical protein M5E03_19050 [Bacillus safensis]